MTFLKRPICFIIGHEQRYHAIFRGKYRIIYEKCSRCGKDISIEITENGELIYTGQNYSVIEALMRDDA